MSAQNKIYFSGTLSAALLQAELVQPEELEQPAQEITVPGPSETLTFGFKVQLLVPGRRDDMREPKHIYEDDKRARDFEIGGKLARGQIEVTLWHLIHDFMGTKNVVAEGFRGRAEPRLDAEPAHPNVPRKYNYWRIRGGNEAGPGCTRNNGQDCRWQDPDSPFRFWTWNEAEVSSPAFTTSTSDLKKTLGWLGMTEDQRRVTGKLCRVLTREMRLNTSAFNGVKQDSYALSIFVGLGGNPIPETTIRRFVVVMWLIEDALFTFSPSWQRHSIQSAPLAASSFLGYANPLSLPGWGPEALEDLIGLRLQQVIDPDKLRRLWYIWHVPVCALPKILQNRDRGTGCVSIPGCGGHAVPNAVQIKHAGSTLRPAQITSWTNVCLSLFQLCHFYEQQDVHRWRLKALLELVVDALYTDSLTGGAESRVVLLRQLDMDQDIPIWKDAEEDWPDERCMTSLEQNPFVPRQVRRKQRVEAQFGDGDFTPKLFGIDYTRQVNLSEEPQGRYMM